MEGNVVPALLTLSLLFATGRESPPARAAPRVPRQPDTGARRESIQAAVGAAAEMLLANGQVIGLSIGLLIDGRPYTFGYGTTERGKMQRPTAHTRYPIGSITKTFTGALLAQAVIEQHVRLDDDIRRYLDGEYPNLEYAGQPIRLCQLINHTSGLPRSLPEGAEPAMAPNVDILESMAKQAKVLADYHREDFLRDLHHVKLRRVPGVQFSYSNAAAQLLGLILERLYGMTYEELVHARITGPLKMHDTRVLLPPAQAAKLPRGYSGGTAFLPPLSTRFPAAGALLPSVDDMLKYMAWHLAESDERVKMTHKPAGDTVWSTDGSFTVGLNWQILTSSDHRSIFQDGSVPGFHSLCVFCPEEHIGIVVLANEEVRATPSNLSALAARILKSLAPHAITAP